MANVNTYTAHMTAATLLNANQLTALVITKIAGNEVSTEVNGATVHDREAYENVALKIQANLAHIVD